MKKPRMLFAAILIMLLTPVSVSGVEYVKGLIKLVLHESTGRFSLYYMSDMAKGTYEPLFLSRDPRTSFFAVMVNSKVYKLGEDSTFKIVLRGTEVSPVLAFEAPFLSVVVEFSFIRTASASITNGVRLDIRLENWGDSEASVGLRVLLDTTLGEKTGTHFYTELRAITAESAVTSWDSDRRWVSRGPKFGLMGSIINDGLKRPDLVHLANWKRLNEVPWKAGYVDGRNFNYLPYSVDDSAVCYYFDPAPLQRGSQRTETILLGVEDSNGFAAPYTIPVEQPSAPVQEAISQPVPQTPAPQIQVVETPAPVVVTQSPAVTPSSSPILNNNIVIPGFTSTQPVTTTVPAPVTVSPTNSIDEAALRAIRELIAQIDAHIRAGGKVTDDEVRYLEYELTRLKSRYGFY
jgi:hypothetical protein